MSVVGCLPLRTLNHTLRHCCQVINFLLTTEIIPLCLRIMESGSELSKTVATFILQKVLMARFSISLIFPNNILNCLLVPWRLRSNAESRHLSFLKILLDETGTGLSYICQTYERFSHVALILGKMVHHLAKVSLNNEEAKLTTGQRFRASWNRDISYGSLARTVHSLAGAALLASLARSATHVCTFARLLARSLIQSLPNSWDCWTSNF